MSSRVLLIDLATTGVPLTACSYEVTIEEPGVGELGSRFGWDWIVEIGIGWC